MKIRATSRESSARPSFHVYWWLFIVSKNTFSVISNSLPSQFMKGICWKQALLRNFVLSFTANILMFSNLPEKLNLPSTCSKPAQLLDNSACGEFNIGQIWFVMDLELVYWSHSCLKMKVLGLQTSLPMLWCPERLTQTPAKVAQGFSARNFLKSIFISTKWFIYFSLKQGLLYLNEDLE